MTDDRLSTLNLTYTYVRLWLFFYTKHEQANGKYDCFFPFVLNETFFASTIYADRESIALYTDFIGTENSVPLRNYTR